MGTEERGVDRQISRKIIFFFIDDVYFSAMPSCSVRARAAPDYVWPLHSRCYSTEAENTKLFSHHCVPFRL